MMDQLLEKVEERITALVALLEAQRQENHRLQEQNTQLISEREHQTTRLQELVALMDTWDSLIQENHTVEGVG